jgi:hypothetical protein
LTKVGDIELSSVCGRKEEWDPPRLRSKANQLFIPLRRNLQAWSGSDFLGSFAEIRNTGFLFIVSSHLPHRGAHEIETRTYRSRKIGEFTD